MFIISSNSVFLRIVKAVVFVGVTSCGGLGATSLVMVWGVPLLLYAPHVSRRFWDAVVGTWLIFTVVGYEKWMGTSVVITGDRVRADEGALLLLNHRTRLDWLFNLSIIARQSNTSILKIILKRVFMLYPGNGFAMQMAQYVFIRRSWVQDMEPLERTLAYFSSIKYKIQILILPEGATYTENSKAKSDDFARQNGLPLYQYVLHPRVTGYNFILQHMRNNKMIDAVYDITVAYPDTIVDSELGYLFSGQVPKEVHFKVKRTPLQEIPESVEGAQIWLENTWLEKETRLRRFYEDTRRLDDDSGNGITRTTLTLYMKVTAACWLLFTSLFIYLLATSSFVRWWTLGTTLFYTIMTICFDGIGAIHANYFGHHKES